MSSAFQDVPSPATCTSCSSVVCLLDVFLGCTTENSIYVFCSCVYLNGRCSLAYMGD